MAEQDRTSREATEGELFRLLVENVRDYAIFVVDGEGEVRSWNPGAERVLGYAEGEIVGRSSDVFFTPEDVRDGVPGQERAKARDEGRANDDRWHVRKDGRRFWVGGTMTPLWEADGTLRGFAKIMRDRTDWKLALERDRFQGRLLDAVGQAVIATDPDGTILYWSRFAETLYGWRAEEAAGRNIMEVVVPQSGVADAGEIMGRLRARECWSGEFEVRRRDGTTFPALVTNTPLFDERGALEAIIGVSSDITERKWAEGSLRESEGRFRGLMEQAPFSVQVFAPDGRTVRVNLAWEELWGVTLDQIHDYNVLEDPQLEAKGVLPRLRRAFAGEPAEIPAIQYDPNETIPDRTRHSDPGRWVSAVAYPLLDDAGRVCEVILVHQDITAATRAEGKLRAAEARWRGLAEAMPQLVWTDLPDGQCDYLSSQWGIYTGIPEAELLGLVWVDRVLHPDDRARTLACWMAAVEDKGDYDLEYRIRRHDGQYRWFKTRGVPIRDDAGRIVKWIGTCTDIEDQRQAQEALRQSEDRFRQLADAMPQIVWTAQPGGAIDYMNRRWQEFTGLPETAGNDAWTPILHPDDVHPSAERWAASLRDGTRFEMEIRLLDRRTRSYRWHLFRTVAARDEAGAVARWFGTATDIDGQKRAEQSSRYLAEASAALAGVVDYESTLQKVANLAVPYFADWSAVDVAADNGGLRRLAVAHRDADKIRLAHELMRLYPPDPEAPGGTFAVLRTGRPEIVSDLTDEMLVQGTKDEKHLALIRSLGLRSYICVPLVVSGVPFGVLTFATAESGRRYAEADLALAADLAHRAGVAVENTRLYQSLRDADRRKDEFLATLAHELRNPLAPIRNSLQILEMPGIDSRTAERSRQLIGRQVHHLVRLVDDLLDVSRVMRGKIDLRKERVDLASVVARAAEAAQPLIDAQRHELSVQMLTAPLPLDADPVRLAQVVGNLLTNAAKYTEPGGHIWLTAAREGGEAVLRVRDDGIGIAPAVLPRVFDLFVQADDAATRSQGGLGIGLTLVKNLVGMHGGAVEARSPGLGGGCEFVVRLPLAAPAAERPDEGAGPERQAAPAAGRRRLLVVDDNRDAADSLAMLLRLQGHEVRVAHDGPSALEQAASYRPEAVFLDLGMPGMDGREVARRLRKTPGLEGTVLAALTGWGQREDRRRTAEAGFDHHLVKPVEPRAVESLLADLQRPGAREPI